MSLCSTEIRLLQHRREPVILSYTNPYLFQFASLGFDLSGFLKVY
ncbi:hypothetical protein ETECTG_CDS0305 [Escherichia phage ETEC-TG]|nr:hypothetical protein ETECTG_CDS0305 [Escherichia phage ETEC-TG]